MNRYVINAVNDLCIGLCFQTKVSLHGSAIFVDLESD